MKMEAPGAPRKKRSGPRFSPFAAVLALIFLCSVTVRSEQANAPVMEPEVREAFNDGLAKFQAGHFLEAKLAFARVTELLPNYSVGWINLGSAEYHLDQLDDAEKHLRKAVHLDPDVTQAWLTLGIIAFRKSELEASLAALSQAVYLEPDNAHAHMYLGVLARKRGWLDAAEDELRKAVELDENYAEAHFNLAMVYTERQPPAIELARRHYYRARALGAAADPDMERILKQAPVTP
jgi:cytochrome c-type biogenesis protein CcmH/NrfG